MKKVSTLVGAAVVGALMSASASAQLVPGGDPYGSAADGGLMFAVWDGNRSYTRWLGTTYSQNEIADLTTEGPEAITRSFAVDLTGLDLLSTSFIVVAADSVKPSRLNTTVSATPTSPTVLGPQTDAFAYQVNTTIHLAFDADGPCAGLTVCISTGGGANDPKYWAPEGAQYIYPVALGSFYADPTNGTSVEFWNITKTAGLGTATTTTRFQSTDGSRVGRWTLQGTGANATISYLYPAAMTEVPLPAAAWLMVSGLLGLGAVGRRRQAAAA
jgi:hypothetical protein